MSTKFHKISNIFTNVLKIICKISYIFTKFKKIISKMISITGTEKKTTNSYVPTVIAVGNGTETKNFNLQPWNKKKNCFQRLQPLENVKNNKKMGNKQNLNEIPNGYSRWKMCKRTKKYFQRLWPLEIHFMKRWVLKFFSNGLSRWKITFKKSPPLAADSSSSSSFLSLTLCSSLSLQILHTHTQHVSCLD